MRAVVQRVSEASVAVEGQIVGRIGCGLLILLAIRAGDSHADAEFLARRILKLRIFPDQDGKMNRCLTDLCGDVLIVSQFTLYGDTRKGNRPSYSDAAKPEIARPLYEYFIQICRNAGIRVATGVFQAHMDVALVNDGPVTLLCDSESELR